MIGAGSEGGGSVELNGLVWLQGTGPGGREVDQSVASRRSLLVPFEFAVDLSPWRGMVRTDTRPGLLGAEQ